MQSPNIEKSEIKMHLSLVAEPVVEDPVVEDPVVETHVDAPNLTVQTNLTVDTNLTVEPTLTIQTNFESKIHKSSFIEPHSESDEEEEEEEEDKPVLLALEHFGTFELELKKVQISSEKKTINLMIDNSGSMDKKCSDGNTQLEQVLFVTERVLRFIEENCPEGNISVSVKTFSTRIKTIFGATPVLSSNLENLIGKLKKIYSDDETDIGLALKEMHTTGPEQYNIFLSDGDANQGIKHPVALAECVDKNAINTFIGFGVGHNPRIFAALSNTKDSSYYFIATIEKSRNAYAEILERILYKCMDGVTIEVAGGKIYNYKTNTLESELYVGNMSGSMKKTFNLYSETPEDLVIVVKSNGAVQQVVNFEGKYEDLQIAFYRQRTLELLYKSTNGVKQNNYLLKAEMKSFMNEIKTYMKNNDMTENVQLKYLCNDIAIVYQTLGTRDAFMYSCSRQASNGDERMHNVVVTNNSRFAYESDSESDSDSDDDVQTSCCAYANGDSDSDNDDSDSDNDNCQRSCGPPRQRSCGPPNDDNDINNFCITDETPFTSENVDTILKSFNDDKN
jgi:hypothetical protein